MLGKRSLTWRETHILTVITQLRMSLEPGSTGDVQGSPLQRKLEADIEQYEFLFSCLSTPAASVGADPATVWAWCQCLFAPGPGTVIQTQCAQSQRRQHAHHVHLSPRFEVKTNLSFP